MRQLLLLEGVGAAASMHLQVTRVRTKVESVPGQCIAAGNDQEGKLSQMPSLDMLIPDVL